MALKTFFSIYINHAEISRLSITSINESNNKNWPQRSITYWISRIVGFLVFVTRFETRKLLHIFLFIYRRSNRQTNEQESLKNILEFNDDLMLEKAKFQSDNNQDLWEYIISFLTELCSKYFPLILLHPVSLVTPTTRYSCVKCLII